jgi:hypothetical protein
MITRRKIGLVTGFLLTINCFAQQSKWQLGTELAPGLTKLYGNDFLRKSNDPMFGFLFGLNVQYSLFKNLEIISGVYFEQKGSKFYAGEVYIDRKPVSNATIFIVVDHITVPILFRAHIGKRVKYYINGGAYIGYMTAATQVLRAKNMTPIRYDNSSFYEDIDAGVIGGIGCSIPIGKKISISTEIRNTLGLYNISSLPVVNDGSIKTNATYLILGMAYRFQSHKNNKNHTGDY